MAVDVTGQIERWRNLLLDTTRRNRLIHCRTGRGGAVALHHPTPAELWKQLLVEPRPLTFPWKRDLLELTEQDEEEDQGLSSEEVLALCLISDQLRIDHLVTELTDKRLQTRLSRLALSARESLSEQGVAILYIAFGFLRWFESRDSDEETRSPLLLVPVRLERDGVDAPWRLVADEDEVLLNHTLARRLRSDFNVTLPGEAEVKLDPDDPACRSGYFDAVRQAIAVVPRWEVIDEAALGTFNFQKLAMWEDLDRNKDEIARHSLCRAIAGDRAALTDAPDDLPGERDLDERIEPHETFHLLDADSSQHAAIEAVKRGANLVLDGPPGTGKSQTIANIIAEMLAAGKTVLFVSEKTAALEVVKRRLDDRGLGDFCLELHSHRANKREVVAELGRRLALPPEKPPDVDDELDDLAETRERLNEYVRELHAVREPLGMSVFAAHGELACLAGLRSVSRCAIPRPLERDAGWLRRLVEVLARLPSCGPALAEHDRHPWRGCRAEGWSLNLRADVGHHVRRLLELLPRTIEASRALALAGFGSGWMSREEWRLALAEARAVLAVPPIPPAWIGPALKRTAEAVVELERVERAIAEIPARLPECSPAALETLTAAGMPDAADVPRQSGRTLREQSQRVSRTLEQVCELRQQASKLDEATRELIAALGVTIRPPATRELRKFAELGEFVAGCPPLRRSWWDRARRQELQAVLARVVEEEQAATTLRVTLVGRLAPRAFAPESAPLAREAVRYRGWFARLWPRWRAIRGQLREWYSGEAPGTAALLADAQALVDYHRRTDFVRQVREQYAADVVIGADGRPDWAATAEGLRTAERLEQELKAPAALREALDPQGTMDRERVGEAAASLARCEHSFREHWQKSGGQLDGEAEAQGGLPRRPPGQLANWLSERQAALARQAAALERLLALLEPGRDVPLDVLPERLDSLRQLMELRRRRDELRERAGLGQQERRVEELAGPAAALLSFLERRPLPLPEAVARGLSDPGFRSELQAIVERNLAAGSAGFDESWRYLTVELFDGSHPVSTGIVLGEASLNDVRGWLEARSADLDRLEEWLRYAVIEREVEAAGVRPVLDEVLAGQVAVEEAADALRARFFRSWLDEQYRLVPALGRFTGDEHEQLIGRFDELDRRAVAVAPARVRGLLLTREAWAGLDEAPDGSELGTLLAEVHKKRRHLPLRTLFARIPTVLPRLKPCLMMSPLAVSTYLQSPDCRFDLVVFDEASQVRPHDAVCAIYRGRQLVVAGDQRQLPPTSFFDRAPEDEDGEEQLSDYESILDVCGTLGLVRRRLRWHYRSRREGLIAFANHFVYGNELVTFPSVDDTEDNRAVAFEYVADGRWEPGAGGGVNVVEAEHAAALVLEHFRQHPEQSLGVIAFSRRQQESILDELEALRRQDRGLEEFFGEHGEEPFFVKNLENVQGDERDAIFLCVGYGPDEEGRVAMRFGPLNQQGGERRLNVAVTRARRSMTVISSMRSSDIDLSRTGAEGARLLRAYLDYAERGPVALRAAITQDGQREADSPFEQEVARELERRGLAVHRQVGCSRFRVDLAVVDPQAPGRYLLGVECDGATYHSSATARDRDRLRQEVLEGLGWRLSRVWSTDWLRNRDRQVKRVLEALERARREPPPSPKPRETPVRNAPAPRPRVRTLPVGSYAKIGDVPEEVIRELVLAALRQFGGMDREGLIRHVRERLGFERTGERIKETITAAIDALIAAGRVEQGSDEGRVRESPRAPAAS